MMRDAEYLSQLELKIEALTDQCEKDNEQIMCLTSKASKFVERIAEMGEKYDKLCEEKDNLISVLENELLASQSLRERDLKEEEEYANREIERLRAQIKRMQGYSQDEQVEANDQLKTQLEGLENLSELKKKVIIDQSEKITLLTKYCHILNDEIETPEHLKGFCDVIAVKQAVKHLL